MNSSIRNKIQDLLIGFQPVALSEMDCVQLMNRTDTKFAFPVQKMPELLALANGHYRILEINTQRIFDYSTTYLDTFDYLFFHQQATGKLERHKVRFRTYESTKTSFLEVKRKTNKNRTVKWRIKNSPGYEGVDHEALQFLNNYLPNGCSALQPVINNKFSRITMVSLESLERVTIDFSLTFSDPSGNFLKLPYLAIAELKREGYTNQSPFIGITRALKMRPTGFSKYCIGSSLLHNLPRKNAFKRKILLLKHIENEYNEYFACQA